MGLNYARMNCKVLIEAKSAARRDEAQRRLDTWDMSPKNVKRLTAFVASFDQKSPAKAPAKAKKAAPAPAVVAQATQVSDDLKAKARKAFDDAFAAAPEGKRQRAGRKASGLVKYHEATVEQAVEAALAAVR